MTLLLKSLTATEVNDPEHPALIELERHSSLLLSKKPRMLWGCGHYDGPLNGLCLHDGAPCWFQVVDEVPIRDEDGETWRSRVYAVCKLSPAQFQRHKIRHKVWGLLLGGCFEYDEGNRRQLRHVHGDWLVRFLVPKGKPRWVMHDWLCKHVFDRLGMTPEYDYPNEEVVAWWKGSDWAFEQVVWEDPDDEEDDDEL